MELDGYGREVPKRLSKIFRGRKHIHNIVGDIEAVRLQLATIRDEDYFRFIDATALEKLLAAAKVMLMRGAPFEKCDCPANHDCPRCEQAGWVPASRVDPKPVQPTGYRYVPWNLREVAPEGYVVLSDCPEGGEPVVHYQGPGVSRGGDGGPGPGGHGGSDGAPGEREVGDETGHDDTNDH